MLDYAIKILTQPISMDLIDKMMDIPNEMGHPELSKFFNRGYCMEIAACLGHLSDDQIIEEVRRIIQNETE